MSRIVQSSGIIIRKMNYRESSMIVDIFTESHGLSGFIVSGVRKSRPTMSPVLFTPGYQLSLVFYERAPHQLWRIKEATIQQKLNRTPFDILRGNTALCMCEVIKKVVHPYDPNTPLYDFLSSYFLALDRIDKTGNLFLHFLTHLSVQLGFEPKGNIGGKTVYFDLKSGHFLEEEPAHPMIMEPGVSELLRDVLHTDIEKLTTLNMNRLQRQKLTDGLINYIRYHSHVDQEIRSYELLKTLW